MKPHRTLCKTGISTQENAGRPQSWIYRASRKCASGVANLDSGQIECIAAIEATRYYRLAPRSRPLYRHYTVLFGVGCASSDLAKRSITWVTGNPPSSNSSA